MGAETPPVFELPAALSSQGFVLRPETDDDLPFLRALYASTRENELATTGWPAEQKLAFCDSQFDAQRLHYRTHIRNCRFEVLECRGEPVGRLYLEPRTTQLNIVDVAFMPAWCGRGIGTVILEAVKQTAQRSGRGVCIFVEQFNPARRLYLRLGFTDVREDGPYFEMEWVPPRPVG